LHQGKPDDDADGIGRAEDDESQQRKWKRCRQPEQDCRHAKNSDHGEHLVSDMPFDRMPSQHKRCD
jgi:hypothetical protein